MLDINEGLDEIESFEDLDNMDDGKGFQFYGMKGKNEPKAAQKKGPLSPSLGLGLNSVTPLNNLMGSGNQGG